MDTKTLTKLALSSYTNDRLDEVKATRIANVLERHDLKKYLRALKALERRKSVYVQVPKKNAAYDSLFSETFKQKRIVIDENPELLLGVRITDDDMVYDLSLEERLNRIAKDIEENYD